MYYDRCRNRGWKKSYVVHITANWGLETDILPTDEEKIHQGGEASYISYRYFFFFPFFREKYPRCRRQGSYVMQMGHVTSPWHFVLSPLRKKERWRWFQISKVPLVPWAPGPGSDGQFILYSCYRALGTGTAMLSYGTLLTIYKTYILMYCTINPNRQWNKDAPGRYTYLP